jgi:hypothetical protein
MLHQPDKLTQKILDLADFIENLPSKDYEQTCGNYCIWGHIKKREARYQLGLGMNWTINTGMRDFFGPDIDVGKIYNSYPYGYEKSPTTKDAASMLRHLAVTGEVQWPK